MKMLQNAGNDMYHVITNDNNRSLLVGYKGLVTKGCLWLQISTCSSLLIVSLENKRGSFKGHNVTTLTVKISIYLIGTRARCQTVHDICWQDNNWVTNERREKGVFALLSAYMFKSSTHCYWPPRAWAVPPLILLHHFSSNKQDGLRPLSSTALHLFYIHFHCPLSHCFRWIRWKVFQYSLPRHPA